MVSPFDVQLDSIYWNGPYRQLAAGVSHANCQRRLV